VNYAMIELDDIDRRIVAVLQAEGRLPMVDLADRVGLSATPCQRRVKRLEEEGVIGRYAALVSPQAMGLGLQALVQITLIPRRPSRPSRRRSVPGRRLSPATP
jgi:Lrp/AsnC family transcriptional regulator, leucine-responsive regulatory protein